MIDYDNLIKDYLKEVDEKVKFSDDNELGAQQKIMIYVAANVFSDLMKKLDSGEYHK